jgi:hypothetical protein
MIPTEQVLLFVQEVRADYRWCRYGMASISIRFERQPTKVSAVEKVYDALLLRRAEKCGAERIYTWNLSHPRRIAPDLADRGRTP